MSTLPDIVVGNPACHEALTVFPLFLNASTGVDYLLSDEAISAGSVTVEEVSEGGSVPNLLVSNKGDSRVLFLEGEELRGAKQNRVLNTSVLIAAHSKTPIPVSCVEQGRWRYRTKHFVSEGSHSSSKLRRFLKGSVSDSLKAGLGHSSDQGAVWREVSRQMKSLGSSSSTGAMSDTFIAHAPKLAEYSDRLKYVEGASGLVVAVGEKIVALDVFDKPATCQKVWDRLLSGVVMDALEAKDVRRQADRKDVEELLARLRASSWTPAPAVGEGEEFRYDPGPEAHASALVYDGAVLHGSVVLAS
jgi:ARG/rhodanese/phosphatase superfamily protein